MHYLVFALILLAIVFGPGLWVRKVLDKYSLPKDRYAGSGAQLARHLLNLHKLEHVKVEVTKEGDHYDPAAKAVRLTEDKYKGHSLTAITVAAHEVGHALQDRDGYGPLKLRSRLVRATQMVEKIGAGILLVSPFMGALTRAPGLGVLMFLGGLLTLGSSTLVHLVTLPTELDASFSRALPLLEKHGILKETDKRHAHTLLKAAALTYVSASLMSLLNIARWVAILRR